MKTNTALLAILAFAAIFSITSVGFATAQTYDTMSTDVDDDKDGSHEGKSCPSKNKKTASFDAELNS